jgi:hypothetical protein
MLLLKFNYLHLLVSIIGMLIAFNINIFAFAKNEYIEYKVEKNDTLSKILKSHSLKPIYGKNGSLEEVLKLNPKKQKNRGNYILPGEIILLPKTTLQAQKDEIKKPASHLTIAPKTAPQTETKQKEVFNTNQTSNSKTNFETNNNENNLSPKNELLIFNNTQPQELPLKSVNMQNSPNQIITSNNETNFSNNMEYGLIMDEISYCKQTLTCKIWLWEQESKCCQPEKRNFMNYKSDSF